jgi:hypothetical protein
MVDQTAPTPTSIANVLLRRSTCTSVEETTVSALVYRDGVRR